MKSSISLRFLMNVALYTIIAISLYLIYSPLNKHPKNATGSSTQFVYQQF